MTKISIIQSKVTDDIIGKVTDKQVKSITEILSKVHSSAVRNAAVDSGFMRNSIVYSINGLDKKGYNSMLSTAPESELYAHKVRARKVGEKADTVSESELINFPINKDTNKTVGYVGVRAIDNNTGVNYAISQEYGSKQIDPNSKKTITINPQPFFRPAVYLLGDSSSVKYALKSNLSKLDLNNVFKIFKEF